MPGVDPGRLRGLYVITPGRPLPDLTERVALALQGGARIVQYRDKGRDKARRYREAKALADLCHRRDALFIVNDDPVLALESDADGVHLGRDDAPLNEARRLLGHGRIIGVSCYADPARAEAAARTGADYLAFGRFHPSRTKPEAVQAHPELLGQARPLGRPLVAIGGITAENGGPLVAAGADMLAVVEAVFSAADIRAAATALSRLFSEESRT